MSAVLPLDEAVAYTTDAHLIRVRTCDLDRDADGTSQPEAWIEFIGPEGVIARRPRTQDDMDAIFDGVFMRPRKIVLVARAQRNGRVHVVIAFRLAGALPTSLSDVIENELCFHVAEAFELDLLELPEGEPLTSLARTWLSERTRLPVSDEVSRAIEAMLADVGMS